MRTLTHTVTPEEAGRAMRSLVPRCFALGEHAYRRLKVQGGIHVNGETARASRILAAGDVIQVHLPSDDAPSAAPQSLERELPPSFIRHMDDDVIVLSKGAPLPTLPASHITSGTLREQLIAMLGADPETFVYHPVNRLDKGTSGLMVVARHAHAQRLLTAQLHTGSFVREYLAVTEGVPDQHEGVIDAPIARIGAGAKRAVMEGGRRAVTHYRVLRTGNGRALIRLRLETGRTHQIRVHFSALHHPCVGDLTYGADPVLARRLGLERQWLHAVGLGFDHPGTGERVDFTSEYPDDLQHAVDVLRAA